MGERDKQYMDCPRQEFNSSILSSGRNFRLLYYRDDRIEVYKTTVKPCLSGDAQAYQM
jgi:hypothetical protein